MSKKAVDIVLLPDEKMMARAVEINADLVKRFGSEIVLNKAGCLPHISLDMGCLGEKDVPSVEKVLEEIAKEASLPDLRVVGIRSSENSKGQTVSVFEVENAKELQSLHENVMDKLAPYLSRGVIEEMIYGNENAAESTLMWIENYRDKSSFENFFPHITIGYGRVETQTLPMTFAASELALCHLGNHCTCRKVLFSIKLEGC
jgi:2'-5' RNA ligase